MSCCGGLSGTWKIIYIQHYFRVFTLKKARWSVEMQSTVQCPNSIYWQKFVLIIRVHWFLWINTSSILLIIFFRPFIKSMNKFLGHFFLIRANNSFSAKSKNKNIIITSNDYILKIYLKSDLVPTHFAKLKVALFFIESNDKWSANLSISFSE